MTAFLVHADLSKTKRHQLTNTTLICQGRVYNTTSVTIHAAGRSILLHAPERKELEGRMGGAYGVAVVTAGESELQQLLELTDDHAAGMATPYMRCRGTPGVHKAGFVDLKYDIQSRHIEWWTECGASDTLQAGDFRRPYVVLTCHQLWFFFNCMFSSPKI